MRIMIKNVMITIMTVMILIVRKIMDIMNIMDTMDIMNICDIIKNMATGEHYRVFCHSFAAVLALTTPS